MRGKVVPGPLRRLRGVVTWKLSPGAKPPGMVVGVRVDVAATLVAVRVGGGVAVGVCVAVPGTAVDVRVGVGVRVGVRVGVGEAVGVPVAVGVFEAPVAGSKMVTL